MERMQRKVASDSVELPPSRRPLSFRQLEAEWSQTDRESLMPPGFCLPVARIPAAFQQY